MRNLPCQSLASGSVVRVYLANSPEPLSRGVVGEAETETCPLYPFRAPISRPAARTGFVHTGTRAVGQASGAAKLHNARGDVPLELSLSLFCSRTPTPSPEKAG